MDLRVQAKTRTKSLRGRVLQIANPPTTQELCHRPRANAGAELTLKACIRNCFIVLGYSPVIVACRRCEEQIAAAVSGYQCGFAPRPAYSKIDHPRKITRMQTGLG